jgi:general stress protein 26
MAPLRLKTSGIRLREACNFDFPESSHFVEADSMAENQEHDDRAALAELINSFRFVMLTTVEHDGNLHSRPMTMQDVEFDGDLWFFTSANTPKAWDVNRNRQVNVSFADTNKQTFASVCGIASLVRDRKKIEELWKPTYAAFFPEGLGDPELALLKVSVHTAEYWDAPNSAVSRAFNLVKQSPRAIRVRWPSTAKSR